MALSELFNHKCHISTSVTWVTTDCSLNNFFFNAPYSHHLAAESVSWSVTLATDVTVAYISHMHECSMMTQYTRLPHDIVFNVLPGSHISKLAGSCMHVWDSTSHCPAMRSEALVMNKDKFFPMGELVPVLISIDRFYHYFLRQGKPGWCLVIPSACNGGIIS